MELARVVVGNNAQWYIAAISEAFTDELLAYCKDKGLDHMRIFDVKDQAGLEVGSFALEPFPECGAIAISTRKYVNPKYRGTQWGGANFHRLQADVARLMGYSQMIATVHMTNVAEVISATQKGNYRIEYTFTDRRTGHELGFMHKRL